MATEVDEIPSQILERRRQLRIVKRKKERRELLDERDRLKAGYERMFKICGPSALELLAIAREALATPGKE